MNVEQAIREYLPNVIHMSLATSIDNKPWVCQVHFAYDDVLNIYFCSGMISRHCVEIEKNPQVAGSISVQHGPADKPRCVDLEGTAEIVNGLDENHPGFKAYNTRFPGRLNLEQFKQENGGRMYKITVSDYYMVDVPQKHHLPWKNNPGV